MVPPVSDPKWEALIKGKLSVSPSYLGIKIALGNAALSIKRDTSPEKLKEEKTRIRELFIKHQNIAKVQQDIKNIFG